VNRKHPLPQLGALLLVSLCSALAPGAPASAANAAPAIAAFDKAFASISDYTATLRVHEAKGTQTSDRVYSYMFMKPHYVKTLILDGDGSGAGGVWIGGTQVSGHQGGILAGFHRKVDVNDPRAVSLRGATIPEGLLQRVVENFATIPGKLTQTEGGKVGGVLTDRLDLKVADPASIGGATEQVMYLSKETHWPLRLIIYAGPQVVVDESVLDLKTNTGLTQADFPF
jgi:outer membrane lipoprotein-sorting protein